MNDVDRRHQGERLQVVYESLDKLRQLANQCGDHCTATARFGGSRDDALSIHALAQSALQDALQIHETASVILYYLRAYEDQARSEVIEHNQ